MNYRNIIENALIPLGLPVKLRKYKGAATKYITYFLYNEQGEQWAENKEVATGFYIQVDIWFKSDDSHIEETAEKVKAFLSAVGFSRTTSQDLYEEDSNIYHKAIRFVYVS